MASKKLPRGRSLTWKEGRRLRAWELARRGWAQVAIAEALGVSRAAVCKWLAVASVEGVDALRAPSRRGQGARLAPAELERLPALLDRGAESFGFAGDVWTCARIGVVLERELGVHYHPDHVRRLLHRLDWTYQKPLVIASQRDEKAIARWLTQTWPALKKRPETRGEPSSSSTSPLST